MGTISDILSADKRKGNIYSFINNASSNGTNEIHIEQICSSFQLDYLRITKDLDAMIKIPSQYRLLKNAYVDSSKKILVLSGVQKGNAVVDQLKNIVDDVSGAFLGKSFFGQKNNEQKTTISTVKCNGCGASNTVFYGRVNECEYCGSPID